MADDVDAHLDGFGDASETTAEQALTLAADGSGVQAGLDGSTFDYPLGAFTTGRIGGREALNIGVSAHSCIV